MKFYVVLDISREDALRVSLVPSCEEAVGIYVGSGK